MRKRGKTKHARRERQPWYMNFVASRPCLARLLSMSGNRCEGRIHVHHMRGRYGVNSDLQTVPLCEHHHRDWHEHRGIFEGWSRERREAWKTWSVEFTRLEYNDEFPF